MLKREPARILGLLILKKTLFGKILRTYLIMVSKVNK